MTNDKLGRAAIRFALKYVRRRYRRQIRIGIGFTAAGLALAAYLASRNVPEG
jgi:ribosomal protein L13E